MKFIQAPHLRDRNISDKERKNLAILDIVRKNGPISRTDISRLANFNIVTVSNYINHYIDRKIVFEKELDESTGGRKPVLVSLNNELGYAVGLGLNADSMVAVLVNLEARVLSEIKKDRPPVNDENMVIQMMDLVDELLNESEIDRGKVFGIGIGVPGVIDEQKRTVRWPGALGESDFYAAIDLKDRFEKKFKVPVLIENDANAAVLAEKWMGLAREVRHVLYMYSGIGCGILIDGEIYRGATGVAGELGVASTEAGKETSESISTALGRWERDLGMTKKALEKMKKGKKTSLKKDKQGNIPFNSFVQAVKDKDSLAEGLVQEAGAVLGQKIAFLANLLNPEVIVVGGGVEECGAPLFDAVKNSVKEWCLDEAAGNLKIIPSAFGDKAVALGAVGIVCREVFAQA